MITVEITFRPAGGGEQKLWADMEEAKLRRLQGYTQGPEAADTVIPLYARLTPHGETGHYIFRANRVTLRQVNQ